MRAIRNCGAVLSFFYSVSPIKLSRWSALINFFSSPVVLIWSLCKLLQLGPNFRGLWLCLSMFCLIVGIFKFMFEEFVNVIFPSLDWSPDRSVGPVSCAQFRVPVSSLSQPSVAW